MNAGKDRIKARERAQVKANSSGEARYLHSYADSYWIEKTEPSRSHEVFYPDVPIRHDYTEAISSQCACNLSGVAHALARVLPRIWVEARMQNKGTDYVNQHPLVVLYVSKLYSLTKGDREYGPAYKICKAKAEAQVDGEFCPLCEHHGCHGECRVDDQAKVIAAEDL